MRLEDQAALIIAVGDLLAVRAVTGAIRAADKASAAALGSRGAVPLGADQVTISGRRTVEPQPRYETRRVIHPEPRYEARPIIHPQACLLDRPIDPCCEPCDTHLPRGEVLPPPWKMKIERIVEPSAASMVKTAPRRADVIRRGSLLDMFM